MRARLNVLEKIEVSDIVNFVKSLGLEDLFEELYNFKIDEWNFEEPDEEVIGNLLEYLEDLWVYDYHPEGDGYFTLMRLDRKNPLVIIRKVRKEKVIFT